MSNTQSSFDTTSDPSYTFKDSYKDIFKSFLKSTLIINSQVWTVEEDNLLKHLKANYGADSWDAISEGFELRKSPAQCMIRWKFINQSFIQKGPWTLKEDMMLLEWVKQNGDLDWTSCSCYIPGRSSKQCRVRWKNSLDPAINKSKWTPEEDFIIFKIFNQLGSSWSIIKNYLPGRTENSIKNRFHCKLNQLSSVRQEFQTRFEIAYRQLALSNDENKKQNHESSKSNPHNSLLRKKSKLINEQSVQINMLGDNDITIKNDKLREKRLFIVSKQPIEPNQNTNKNRAESMKTLFNKEFQSLELNEKLNLSSYSNKPHNLQTEIPLNLQWKQLMLASKHNKRNNILSDLASDSNAQERYSEINDSNPDSIAAQKVSIELPDFRSLDFCTNHNYISVDQISQVDSELDLFSLK